MNTPLLQRVFASGIAWVLLATCLLSFKGILARLAYEQGVSVDAVLIWRFIIAVPLFWLGAIWLRKGNPAVALSRRQWLAVLATGLLFFASAWSDFHAIELLGASISRVILYTFPMLVMLIQAWQLRQAPNRRQLGIFLLAWVGILMILLPDWQQGQLRLAGIACALGAASCYAIFWCASKPLTQALGSMRFNQLSNSVTLVAVLLLLLPGQHSDLLSINASGWLWLLLLVVFATCLPFFLLFEGLRRVNASEASLITMFGPVVTVLAAQLVFTDETLVLMQWFGMAVVIGSISLIGRTPARPAR